MPENKVVFGLKNSHYAVISEDESTGEVTYGTPKPLPGSVELSLEVRGDPVEFYADDMLFYSASNNQGYNGTLTIAKLTEQFKQEVLAEEMESNDSVLIEKQNAKPKNIAFMFEFDGDQKAVRHLMYNCTVSRPNLTGSTKTDSVEPSTTELTFIASPREKDRAVKVSTTGSTTASVYNAWYDSVYEPKEDTTSPTVTVSPSDGSASVAVTTDIIWTFSEAIREADVTSANFFLNDDTGAEVASTLSLNADQTEVTLTPDSELATTTDYTAIATQNIKDVAGNNLKQNSVTNFTTA
ncbi:major tail protein [Salibacterium lacus]|uniref:Major tail protein n=1 Tax=Salibacterium lacus TaxID=1898109 RepID=A0ABW5T0D9_9BACI